MQNTFYFSYSILVFCTEFNLGSLKLLQSEKVKFPLFMYKDLHALQINFTVDIPTQQWSTGISLHVFSIDLSTNLLIDLVLRTWFPLICLLLTSLSSIKNQSLVLLDVSLSIIVCLMDNSFTFFSNWGRVQILMI